MTLPLRKKHRTTVRKAALKLLVGTLAISFLSPPLSRPISAAEFERINQPTEWQNRSQPTWVNSDPVGQAPGTQSIRPATMLEWGSRRQLDALNTTSGSDHSAQSATPLVNASDVPEDVVGRRLSAGTRPTTEPIELTLAPATGVTGETYKGVHLIDADHYDDTSPSLARSNDGPTPHNRRTIQKVAYTNGGFQEAQRDSVAQARLALERKVQMLRARAESKFEPTRALHRTTHGSQDAPRLVLADDSLDGASELIAFTDPMPPVSSDAQRGSLAQSPQTPNAISGRLVAERRVAETRIAQSQNQISPVFQGGGDFSPQRPSPQSRPEDAYSLPDVREGSAPQLLDQPNAAPAAPLNNTDPFGTDDFFDSSAQSRQPAQQPPAATQPRQQPARGAFDGLFSDPSPRDADLEAELERLENEPSQVDEDLEQGLRDLDSEDSNRTTPDESPMDDARDDTSDDEELPSRRDDDETDEEFKFDDCDRVYDERNCCAEDSECQAAFEILRNSPLSTVSLDISPSFDPSESDPDELMRRKTEKLSSTASRSWTDRNGNVVASGRLDDFRQGKIHVRTDDGGIATIPYRNLSRDDLCFVSAWWQLPAECQLGNEPLEIRNWTMTTFTWKAAGTCHKPLYFEHVELERYGHSAGPVLQPVLSGAHFFANVILLPYNNGLHPPTECLYDLGHYRPGDCAPWLVPAFPFHRRATLFETALGLGLWGFL